MNKKIEIGVSELQAIRMSEEEKGRMHDQILHADVVPMQPVRSKWVAPLFVFTTVKRFWGKAKGFYKKRV